MAKGNKVIKSVSFNTVNAEDDFMLKTIKRRNFSGYVKKLIMEDLKAKAAEKGQEIELKPKQEDNKPLSAKERLEMLKNQSIH
jgi:hypothetical protein